MEPPAKPNPVDPFRSAGYRTLILGLGGYVAVLWFSRGPSHPAFALTLCCWTFALSPALVEPIIRFLPRRLRVPPAERVLHRIMGVGLFGSLLNHSGYNRQLIHPMWRSHGYKAGTRAGLHFRARAAQAGGDSHGACLAIHLLVTALALSGGQPSGALWILMPGVILHLYPLLLQRSVMLRLQPLLDKLADAKPQQ